MSKSEILAALPKLSSQDRAEILQQLWSLEEEEAVRKGPSSEEKQLLDRELADYEKSNDPGTPWKVAEARLRRRK